MKWKTGTVELIAGDLTLCKINFAYLIVWRFAAIVTYAPRPGRVGELKINFIAMV